MRLRRSSTRSASLMPSKPARRQPTEAMRMTTRGGARSVPAADTDTTAASDASGSRRSSNPSRHRQPERLSTNSDLSVTSTGTSRAPASATANEDGRARLHMDHHDLDADSPAFPNLDRSSADRGQATLVTFKSSRKRKRSLAGVEHHPSHPRQSNDIRSTSSPDGDGNPTLPMSNHPSTEPLRKRARGSWSGRGRGRGRGARGCGPILSTHGSFQTDVTSTPPSVGLPDKDRLSDDLQAGSERPAKQSRRLPGRRRAPNADPSVEADLRRQLQLKTAYRAVVKAIKPVLAELADRTINDAKNDPTSHEQSGQYRNVKAALDAKLADRVHYLDQRLAILKEYVERRKTAELLVAKTAYDNETFELQEDHILRCQYALLSLLRESQQKAQDDAATDDEDGIIPRRRGMQYQWRTTGFLDSSSDSRSRFYLETQNLWKQHELRARLQKEMNNYLQWSSGGLDEHAVNSSDIIAPFDADHRGFALAAYNTNSLAAAAEFVERGEVRSALVKALPNEDAIGLQLLVAAIDNPSSPALLTSINPERMYEECTRSDSTSTAEAGPPKSAIYKSTQGRQGRGQSPASTSLNATAGLRTSALVLAGSDDLSHASKLNSSFSTLPSNGPENRISSPRKTCTPTSDTLKQFVHKVSELNDTEPKPSAESRPPRNLSVSSNKITDLLNKSDDPFPPTAPSVTSVSSPVASLPTILPPISKCSSMPSIPPSGHSSMSSAADNRRSGSSHCELAAPLLQPAEYAQKQYMSTLYDPGNQAIPISAPIKKSKQEAPAARKAFWDTITIGSMPSPTDQMNADKVQSVINRQDRNPSAFSLRSESLSLAKPSATAIARKNDGDPEAIEMAPPAPRIPVSYDAPSSRRSSSTSATASQPRALLPAAPAAGETSKRSTSRDKALEQRQNRWRAAVPPQHGPTPPFRPDLNPPQNAFLKHQGWTVESQMRLSQQGATVPSPQPYPSYASPYDCRSRPSTGYPQPPPSSLYNQGYSFVNTDISAVPFITPPFTCPPGPPPYQSIYASPSQSYTTPPPSLRPPSPAPMPPPLPPPRYGALPLPVHPKQHYGTQYGGLPILPATIARRSSDDATGEQAGSRYQAGHPAQHPPVFSQQQGQYGGSIVGGRGGQGGRRRWKNPAPGTEFRPYMGPKRH